MKNFFSNIKTQALGTTQPKKSPAKPESADLPTLLSDAQGLVSRLQKANDPDFPLLNEATRQGNERKYTPFFYIPLFSLIDGH